ALCAGPPLWEVPGLPRHHRRRDAAGGWYHYPAHHRYLGHRGAQYGKRIGAAYCSREYPRRRDRAGDIAAAFYLSAIWDQGCRGGIRADHVLVVYHAGLRGYPATPALSRRSGCVKPHLWTAPADRASAWVLAAGRHLSLYYGCGGPV